MSRCRNRRDILSRCVARLTAKATYVDQPWVERAVCQPPEKIAKCMVSNSSPFGLEPTVPETGWVKPGETYELLSGRLGDIAVVCFGGYRTDDGDFTPTVMGVRRHIFAEPAATMEGLDVSLDIPLKKTMRLRMMDPPTWPGGLHDPAITISLDLGSDGAIPMTRALMPAGENVAGSASGRQAPGRHLRCGYFFYSRIQAMTPTKLPVPTVDIGNPGSLRDAATRLR